MEPTPRSLFLKAPTEFLSDRLDIGTRTLRIEFRTKRALAPWVSGYQDFIAYPYYNALIFHLFNAIDNYMMNKNQQLCTSFKILRKKKDNLNLNLLDFESNVQSQ